MTREEKAKISQALIDLSLATQTTPTSDSLTLYVESLKALPLSAVLQAIRRVSESWTFNTFPALGVLREAAGCVDGGNPIESKAVVAWSKLRGKPGKAYDREGFVNDPIAKTVFNAMGGGYTTADGFGRWATDQEPWKRKEFIQLYLEAARQAAAQPELSHQGGAGALVDLRMGGMGNA